MTITIINPRNNHPLHLEDDDLVDFEGNVFPIVNGVVRIAVSENYAKNFGIRWSKFDKI